MFDICMPFPSGRHVVCARDEDEVNAKLAYAGETKGGLAKFPTGPTPGEWVAINPAHVISVEPHGRKR